MTGPHPSYREALLGVPEELQREVDADELATTRGPQVLEARLAPLTAEELRLRYRTSLARATYPFSARAAAQDAARAIAAAEARQIRRGGNR